MPAASRRTGRATVAIDVRASVTARCPLSAGAVERLARAVLRSEGVRWAALSVTVVGLKRIRTLNRIHLGHDRPTDVIAFTLRPDTQPRRGRALAARPRAGTGRGLATRRLATAPVIGDIYVCAPVAAAQGRRFGSTPREELRRLIVHGVLHVLGYDHPGGARRLASPMWRRQERWLVEHP